MPFSLKSPEQFPYDHFARRHIGPSEEETQTMLKALGLDSLSQFTKKALPEVFHTPALAQDSLPPALSEAQLESEIQASLNQCKSFKSYLGKSFRNCETPAALRRNILENPAYYTAYTPYQAEISQGRMTWLFQFQTLITELTGLAVAPASLLDEASTAVETMALAIRNYKGPKEEAAFFIDNTLDPHIISALKVRAYAWDTPLWIDSLAALQADPSRPLVGGISAQLNTEGALQDMKAFAKAVQAQNGIAIAVVDPLAAFWLDKVGHLGIDVAVGHVQRLGLPMYYGSPHASFLAAKASLVKSLPGRLVGKSKDRLGGEAYRLSLQTREQHIRREKANSNICTSQSLTAILATAYAAYHGYEGLLYKAKQATEAAHRLAAALKQVGIKPKHSRFFDTLNYQFSTVEAKDYVDQAALQGINLYHDGKGGLILALDETVCEKELHTLAHLFGATLTEPVHLTPEDPKPILAMDFFEKHRSESDMMRLAQSLGRLDYGLGHGMIPLGSCTMKLNAAFQLSPLSHPTFQGAHPYAPKAQMAPLHAYLEELETLLATLTGFHSIDLQPNSGAQGEYAGLLAIRRYHDAKGDSQRRLCLIPESAHGTNPSSAISAGLKPMPIKMLASGEVDLDDLKSKVLQHSDQIAALMITYPSTNGIFDTAIETITDTIRSAGGLVYMDGANFNSLMGLAQVAPRLADVMHLNLHKTFAIPHGGGGPGAGPIGLSKALSPFKLTHPAFSNNQDKDPLGCIASGPLAAVPGLLVSYAYIRALGLEGIKTATAVAMLSANYLASKLSKHYPLLFQSKQGLVAHECIINLNHLPKGLSAEDVAKRLSDYGLHAPTLSFPVAGTLMIEPTESEPLSELDRLIEAMSAIAAEIEKVRSGLDPAQSPLTLSPHSGARLMQPWDLPYSPQEAFYPMGFTPHKLWPFERLDNTYGDRNPHLTDSAHGLKPQAQ